MVSNGFESQIEKGGSECLNYKKWLWTPSGFERLVALNA